MAQRLSRNLQRESQDLMSNFVDDTKADAAVHGFDDPSTTNSDVDVRNESLLNNDATLADDDWNSFVMMGDVTDYSDDDSSSESSMPSRPATPLANLSLEDAMSDWIAEFLWEMCTSGLGNPKYTFSAQPPAALSPQIKTILARIPFRASPCSLYLALWYTSRLPVSFHLPHFAFPPGSPQYDFYMDFIGLSKNSNTSLPEGPEAAPYRLFCLGLFFAYKWLEEYDMKSSVWCDIFKLSPRVLNSLEMNALRIFEHTLAIDELEWMRWLLELQCDRPAFPSISRIRPSDVDAARRVSLDWLLDHTCLPISNEGSGSWFHPSSGSRSGSPSAYSNSPSPSTDASVPVPEAYFIGKSERILTKRLMLERELAQLGMTEEEYDAEEDHTPICSTEESLRRVLDSAEAYRAAEDARLAKAARKEAERLRIEGEKERIRQERERMERERLDRHKRREEAKREEARKAEEAARRAREQAAEEEAKAKRIALAAQAEAEVLAKAIEDNKAKKNAWRSQYKWDVAPSRPLPPVPTTSTPSKRSSPTNSLKRPSPSRSSPPSSRPHRRGSFSSDSSSTSSTSSFSSKPTSSASGSSALFIKAPSSSSYIKAPVQSAPATTTGFGAPTFSSTAKSVNSGSSGFHRNFSSSAYQRHAQAQRAANMFGTVFVPLKRTGSHGSAGINVGANGSWRKEKQEEGWMEMV